MWNLNIFNDMYNIELSLVIYHQGKEVEKTIMALLSSDKIRAKILDLRALHNNLCPKSARILSAAITHTILLPAGVRGSCDGFHSGVG